MNDISSASVILLGLQSVIALLGTVIIFMIKRVLSSIDSLAREDREIRELVHAYREDTLKRFADLQRDFYAINGNDRRAHPRS